MKSNALESIEILKNNSLFDERESGKTHTKYEIETMFFSCIKNGDIPAVKNALETVLSEKIITGKLSENSLRQMQYWAVCCVTLATRYAIQGGLDETEAFNFSDECIQKIDLMTKESEIIGFLRNKSIEITSLVSKSKINANCPYSIRKCVHYINTNLHNKLSVEILAKECSLSEDYLSALFKKSMGVTISQHIRKKRLEAARSMLNGKNSCSEVAYYLGFCSESYFIKCFKEEYGITPSKYAASLNF